MDHGAAKERPAMTDILTRRDILSRLAATGGLATLLAACSTSPGAGGSDAASAAKSKAPATIHLGERAINEEEAFDKRLPVFKDQVPYVTVQRDVITGD